MLCIFLLLITTTKGDTVDSSPTSSVGEAFSLDKVDVEGYVSGGKHLFSEHLPENCFTEQHASLTKKNYHLFHDQEELVGEMAVSIGLTSPLELSARARYLSASHSGKSGYLMEILYISRTRTLSEECLMERALHHALLHDLRTLPYPIRHPHLRSSWQPYWDLIEKWGTHLLQTTQFGVKVVLHSTKQKTDNKVGITAHFCSKMSEKGIDIDKDMFRHGHLLDKCASLEYTDMVEHEDEVEEVYVYGGRPESQARVQQSKGQIDPRLQEMLSQEALTHNAPVKNSWQSVPHLLYTRFAFEKEGLGSRTSALRAFYQGFHLFGCSNDMINGNNVTIFINAGPEEKPVFKCLQARPGCQTDDDCQTWPFPYLSPCYCAGRGCLGLIREGIKTKVSARLGHVRYPNGSFWDESNWRCLWSVRSCRCESWELEEVWPLNSYLFTVSKPELYPLLLVGVATVLLLALSGWFILVRKREGLLKEERKSVPLPSLPIPKRPSFRRSLTHPIQWADMRTESRSTLPQTGASWIAHTRKPPEVG